MVKSAGRATLSSTSRRLPRIVWRQCPASAIKQGNGTFQFGGQRSFDQRYNTDNIFNPYARDGR
jgi:hypothetical protein